MAKGQMRSNKEKKKPKAEHNKKKKGSPAPSPFSLGKPRARQRPSVRRGSGSRVSGAIGHRARHPHRDLHRGRFRDVARPRLPVRDHSAAMTEP